MNVNEFFAEWNEIQATEAAINERKAKVESNRAEIVAEIKGIVENMGIQPSELFEADALAQKKRKPHAPVLAKYRSDDGKEWSGRGVPPKWMKEAIEQGRTKEEFAVT